MCEFGELPLESARVWSSVCLESVESIPPALPLSPLPMCVSDILLMPEPDDVVWFLNHMTSLSWNLKRVLSDHVQVTRSKRESQGIEIMQHHLPWEGECCDVMLKRNMRVTGHESWSSHGESRDVLTVMRRGLVNETCSNDTSNFDWNLLAMTRCLCGLLERWSLAWWVQGAWREWSVTLGSCDWFGGGLSLINRL